MWEFYLERQSQFWTLAYGHALLVLLSVAIGTVIGVGVAVLVTRVTRLEPVANAISSIGLTIPSFALVGLLLPLPFGGIGPTSALIAVTFYAVFPVLRNAVVGLQGVDHTLVESAKGMGMGSVAVLRRVQLPLAWPVILAGIRVSTQMSFGVAAIAAYVLGPGFGAWIFTGLTQLGGLNAFNFVFLGTVAVIVIALVFDALLLLLGRATTSKGIRA